jgi:hypothetical protein
MKDKFPHYGSVSREQQIAALEKDWAENPRWKGVKRGYSAADVVRLRGSLQIEYTLAKRGAEKLWDKVNGGAKKGYVNAFGAITAGQAMQQAKAGLEAVYLSGWQVAADGNTSETMYPDQSLYAYDSVPTMVRRINNTFKRADEIQWGRGINPGRQGLHRLLPAHRGRRRSRLRRRAERLRTDEEHDRRRRRRRALRRPAGRRQEVRPHGWQGAGAHAGSLREADRRAFRRRRDGRAHHRAGPYRRRSRQPDHQRPRRQRQALPDRRAHAGRLLPRQERPGAGHQPRRGLRALRRPGVVRDRRARHRLRPRVRAGRARRLPGQAAELQLLAVLQLEEEPGRQADRPSRTSCRRWATSTSSSRWPASTSTGTTPSSSPTPTRAAKA